MVENLPDANNSLNLLEFFEGVMRVGRLWARSEGSTEAFSPSRLI